MRHILSALLLFGLGGAANAALLQFDFGTGTPLSGGFIFDEATQTLSNVNVVGDFATYTVGFYGGSNPLGDAIRLETSTGGNPSVSLNFATNLETPTTLPVGTTTAFSFLGAEFDSSGALSPASLTGVGTFTNLGEPMDVVPLPAGFPLLLGGFAALAWLRRSATRRA